uniref:Glycosyltransferase 2-like domain-containing protein n=1 Tax=Chaetoceros debilis TaxID=122233 RepID=A0A7S3PXQ2_9STRA|mmetsp:Transcript_23899/g.35554  ORF Transcript_23899/g.35554 Transcript_23899/m.35554 type:complete len:313 (+) Transcript_23899:171-1109(+)
MSLGDRPHIHIDPPTNEKIRSFLRKLNIVIFTCTYYQTTEDLRFHQCLETLQSKYGANSVPVVVVDGSPPEVHEVLKNSTGAIVRKETGNCGKGKGGALREAAQVAASLPGVDENTWLCWQEAEKSHMMQCWARNVFLNIDSKSDDNEEKSGSKVEDSDDIITPFRDVTCFQRSYPIEQYHSESYGNYYLNCVMNEALTKCRPDMQSSGTGSSSKDLSLSIDWHFGPFAFRRKLLHLWMEYKGTSYDAQLIPIVHALRKGHKVNARIHVPFELDSRMKDQEEGDIDFIEKRLHQLNGLDPMVKKSWSDEFYC